MKLANVPVNEMMKACGIKNNTQIYQWVKWYQDGEVHRLQQPLGKQYSYGKGPFQEDLDEGIAHNNPQAVKEKGVIMSMSRKGMPADNAIIETFHASLKYETFYLEGLLRTTNDLVVQTVQAYINYYNNTRILAKLNHLSPVEYRKKVAKQEFDGDS